VKIVLIQHVELGSKVTLGVLCDQIVPPDDPMGDEDPAQSCTDSEQERMLIDTLLVTQGAVHSVIVLPKLP